MYVYRWYSLYSDAFNTGMYLHLVTVRTQRKPFQTSAPALLGHDPIDCVGPALCGVGSVKGKVPQTKVASREVTSLLGVAFKPPLFCQSTF